MRVNLIVSEELRDMVAAWSVTGCDGIVHRAAAELLNTGALFARDNPSAFTELFVSIRECYPLAKAKRSPSLTLVLDQIERRAVTEAAARHALTPKARAYRVFIMIGLALQSRRPLSELSRPGPLRERLDGLAQLILSSGIRWSAH